MGWIIRHKKNGSLMGIPNGRGSLDFVAVWPTKQRAMIALRTKERQRAIQNRADWEILPTAKFK